MVDKNKVFIFRCYYFSHATNEPRTEQVVLMQPSHRMICAFNHLNYLVIRLMSITRNHVVTIQITSVNNKVSSKNLHIIFKIINTGRKSMIDNLNQTCQPSRQKKLNLCWFNFSPAS